MAEPPNSFLSRWSRRKREPDRQEREEAVAHKGKAAPAAAAPKAAGDIAEVADAAAADEVAAGDPEVVAKLPDIDSLDETSDFKPFLAEGVPEVLRRRALRKLWRLNPVFAHLDGLNDYDQDFTDAAMVLPNLKSIYKVGKGMLGEPEAQAAPAGSGDAESAEAPTAAVGEPQPVRPPESVSAESSPPESLPPGSSPRDPAAPDVMARAESDAAPGRQGAAGAGDRAPPGPRRRRAESRRWGESSQ